MNVCVRLLASCVLVWAALISTANAYTISGTAYAGGAALPNAAITLVDATTSSQLQQGTTNGSGQYSFTVNAGTYNLNVVPPPASGFLNAVVNGVVVVAHDVAQDIVLITSGKRLSGVITTFEGVPVAGAQIRAYGPQDITVTTDAAGNYSFELTSGTYRLIVSGVNSSIIPGLGGTWYTEFFVASVDVTADVVRNASLPQFFYVHGRVTDGNGVPVVGVGVNFRSSNYTSAAGAVNANFTSDANGNFTARATAADGYSAILTPPANTSFVETNVSFSVAGDLTRDFVLQPKRHLTGVITTFEGVPVAGAQIRAYGPQDITVTTGAAGNYAFDLTPGTYRLIISGINSSTIPGLGGTWYTEFFAASVDVTADVVHNASLPQFYTVQGRVTDTTGVPISGVAVIIRSSNYTSAAGALNANFTSDANGNFTARATAADGYSAILTPAANSSFVETNVSFSVAGNLTRDFVLQMKKKLTGVITTAEGAPLAGAQIRAYGPQDITVTTGAAGNYSFDLTPGNYRLILSGVNSSMIPGLSGTWYTEFFAASVDVTADVVHNASLPQFYTVQGHVTDTNGVPVTGVEISFRSSNYASPVGSLNANFTSDANGNFTARATAADGYSLIVTPGTLSGFVTSTTPSSISGDKQLNVILPFHDVAPPNIISGPTFRSVTSSSVVVEWQTDEPAHGWAKAGGVTVQADDLATTHSVQITGLSPSTAYAADVSVTDASGNGPTVKSASFTTAAIADIIAPVILEGPTVTGSSANGLVVEWVTSEPAKGSLTYGVNGVLGSAVLETALSVAHRIQLTGLAADTVYSVQVNATDAAGNGPTPSRTRSGRTLPAPDVTPPVIVNGPLVSDITESAAMVSWKTDEPSTGGVSWNDGVAYGVLTDDRLDTDHSARITGLSAGKTYHLTVSSKDILGNGPTLSRTVDFVTQSLADTTAPAILSGPTVMNVTHQSAVIQWDTDEPTDSQIVYGTNPANLDKSDSRAALTKHHSVPLVGLSPSTTYTLQVRSKDAAGNVSLYSTPLNLTTDATADTKSPVFDTPPQVGYTSTDRAVIKWKTNKLTDAQLEVTQNGQPVQVKNVGTQSDDHEVALTGLKASQSYSVTVVSTDLSGNTTSQSLGSFSTPPTPDSAAPQITEGPSVVSVSDTQAVVRWVTDELGDSRVAYGRANAALSQITGDIAYRKEHVLVLTKLHANTAYQFRVGSSDPSGNGPTQSSVVSFTTGAQADITAPLLSAAPAVTGLTATAATIAWTTNEISTSTVNYGTVGLTQKAEDLALTTGHSITLASLAPSTHYQFAVSSADASGNRTDSATFGFDTPAPAAVTLASINISGADTLDAGTSSSYSVIATYSDGTTNSVSATWSFSGTAASFDQAQGLLSANSVIAAETVTLTASYGGQSAQKSITVRPATGTQPINYTASFNSGWTLAGNGLASSIDVAATFGVAAIAANVTTIWAWDAANTRWRFYSPKLTAVDLAAYVQSKGYQQLTSIAPREGFWVNASSVFSLQARSGQTVSVGVADLVSWWNLVSTGTDIAPPDFNRGLSDTPPTPGATPKNFTTLWAWDNVQSNWYFYSPSLEALGPTKVKEYTDTKGYLDFATQNRKLGQGTGFWVNR